MRELTIYDTIGSGGFFEDGLTDKVFKSMLDEVGPTEELVIRINSDGGDVFQGQAIYNMLKRHQGHVTAHIDGIAASIASVIAMAADEILMPINSMMMIHNPHGVVMGESKDMREMSDVLDKVKDSIVNVYADRTALDRDSIVAMMDAETWFLPDEAEQLGFATAIDSEMVVHNKIKQRFWIHNMPELPAGSFDDEDDPEESIETSIAASKNITLSARELDELLEDSDRLRSLKGTWQEKINQARELDAEPLPIPARAIPNFEARKRYLEILSEDI